ATFVMFSTDGSVLPEIDPVYPPAPVLRVTVALNGDLPPAPLTTLCASALRASDPGGANIPECPTFAAVPPARICFGGPSCDINRDGALDVRDLVVMVHCVNGSGPCPPGGTAFDCDGNGQSTLDDVLCCAQAVLHGNMPPGP